MTGELCTLFSESISTHDEGYTCLSTVIPAVSYSNADISKKEIIRNNRNKSGVYKWKNNINGREYVGSSTNLVSRFYSYFSLKHLEQQQSRSLICKALLKYGHSAFTLEILEYCKPGENIAREQYYINLLKPEYNILAIAGSSYGHKLSYETKAKMRQARAGITLSQETKDRIAEALLGRKHSAESLAKMKNRKLSDVHLAKLRYHLAKLNSTQGTKVKVIDTVTNEITRWDSISKAAVWLKGSNATIWRYYNAGKLYKNRYAIVLED